MIYIAGEDLKEGDCCFVTQGGIAYKVDSSKNLQEKLMKRTRLLDLIAQAGDRRDWETCEELDADLEALENDT